MLKELADERAVVQVVGLQRVRERVGHVLRVEVVDDGAAERHPVGHARLDGGLGRPGDVVGTVVVPDHPHRGILQRERERERAIAARHIQHARAAHEGRGGLLDAGILTGFLQDVRPRSVAVVVGGLVLSGNHALTERARGLVAQVGRHGYGGAVVVVLQELPQDAGLVGRVAGVERVGQPDGHVGRDGVVGVGGDVRATTGHAERFP